MNWSSAARWSRAGVVGGWVAVAVLVVVGTGACNAIWAFANPAPHHWDNADYLNQAYADAWAYRYGGPSPDPKDHPHLSRLGPAGVWDSLLHLDVLRPPGYRVVSLPFVYLGTGMLPTLRAVSLGVFWATLYVLYRTGRTVLPGPAGVVAGVVSAALVALYLEVGWSVRVYGTEYTLYLAVAAMMLCLARATRPAGRTHGTWVGLGLALGLGVLSKLSFLLLAGPAGLVAGALVLGRRLPGLTLPRLVGSAVLGAAMVYPYYRFHLFSALGYGQDMMQFSRHSLGRRGLGLVRAWLSLHCDEGMGWRASLVLAGLGGIAAVGWTVIGLGRRPRPTPVGGPSDLAPAFRTAAIGLAAGVPILLFQLGFSVSDNARHMTPAYLPITVAVVVAAAATGALSSGWSWPVLALAAVAMLGQVSREFFPLTTTPDDVWDWEPLYRIVHDDRHVAYPVFGRVGNLGQFNEPSLIGPWYRRGDRAFSQWLWRPEAGPFDWSAVEASLDRYRVTVAVTVVGLSVPTDASRLAEPADRDNAHDAEFAARMAREPGWVPAGRFPIGVVNRGEAVVFVRVPTTGPTTRPTTRPDQATTFSEVVPYPNAALARNRPNSPSASG